MSWLAARVFIAMVALDYAWAHYTIAAAARQPIKAGIWASAITALGAYSVLAYTADHTMLWPAIAGAFVGTVIAVWKV